MRNIIMLLSLYLVLVLLIVARNAAAGSLKEEIGIRLRESAAEADQVNEEEDEGTLIDTDVASNETQEAAEGVLLQLATKNKMSFRCYAYDQEENCESEYCLWKNGVCAVSPAAYEMLCSFYCEASICTQPPASAPPETVCPVKVSAIDGLCEMIKSQSNCEIQHGLCKWQSGSCQPVPSCCSLATQYCKTKKKPLLTKALKSCAGFANSKTICSFAKTQC